ASPRYGERWGRYWLDVARYADTKGYVFFQESDFPWSYTYRDYVIRAFNEDLPYDRFLTEQLAADQPPLGADRRPPAPLGFPPLGGRVNEQREGHPRRPHRRGLPRPARPDGDVRSLPRPQVRPHPDEGLLLALRRLRRPRRADGAAAVSRPAEDGR